MNIGKIQIIATPIGNLKDITFRAVEALKDSDIILCEDTRISSVLLNKFGISKPLLSYHQHSSQSKINQIMEYLTSGKTLGLITDAGTPGISDPGNLLISNLIKKIPNIIITPIPGPSAAIAALSISGFPTDKYIFMGFPPHKNKRNKFFKELSANEYTTVFYESGHRISKCLGELHECLGVNRQIVVCRELTKKFETIYRGTAENIINELLENRGEFVIVVSSR